MDETIKEFIDILITQNTNFKDMMQFAISGIITILVIFLGAHFFTMRGFRKEELLNVQSELELKIRNDYLPELQNEIKEIIKETTKNEIKELKNRQKQLKLELYSLKDVTEINEKCTETKIKSIEGGMLELEGDLWTYEGVHASALLYYIRAGTNYIDANPGKISGILKKIEETIDKLDTIETFKISWLQRFLDKLNSDYHVTVDKIIQKLKNK